MLAIIGTLVCTFMGLGNQRDAIVKGIPWNTVMLVGGVCTLMGVASAAGVTDYIGGAVTMANCTDEKIAKKIFLYEIVLAIIGALLSALLSMIGVFNI